MRRYVLPLLAAYLDLIVASTIAGLAGYIAIKAGLPRGVGLMDGWEGWLAAVALFSVARAIGNFARPLASRPGQGAGGR